MSPNRNQPQPTHDPSGRGTRREFTLLNYWELVLRRLWTILPISVVVFVVTALWTFLQPRVYVSNASFMLEPKETSFDERAFFGQDQTRPLAYYQSIIRSVQFRQQLEDSLRKNLPSRNEKGQPYILKDIRAMARDGLILRTGDYENMVRLTARANDPLLAFKAAVFSADLLKNRAQELDREELSNAVNFIEQQKSMAIEQLEAAEKALQEFKEKSSVVVLEEGGVVGELQRLENQLVEVQTQKQLAMANLRAFENRLSQFGRGVRLPSVSEPSEAAGLRREVADLETKRAAAEEGSEEKARLDRLVEDKKRVLVNILLANDPGVRDEKSSNDYQALKAAQEGKVSEELNVYVLENRERYYRTKIAEFKTRHPDLADNTVEYMRLMRSKTVSENLYNFLFEHGEESKIKAATGSGGLRIMDRAVEPEGPVPVEVIRNLLMGLMFGLGMGFGVALMQEYMDHSIKSSNDIAQSIGLSVMGQIPLFDEDMTGKRKTFSAKIKELTEKSKSRDESKSKSATRRPLQLITGMSAKSPAMEAYRTLRANLQFANVDTKVHTLTISSPAPGEGKSVTSANLAIAFALLGEPVILVDADMRKPRQHKLFKTSASPGLSDMLVEDLPLSKVLRDTSVPNLKLIPAGRIPPNPSEILASQRMADLCNKLKNEAKVVICDTPPILPVSDAVILGSRTQGVLLVLLHEKTTIDAANEALILLQKGGARVLGAVLNGIQFNRSYGYYRYYGKHYYSYYSKPEKSES